MFVGRLRDAIQLVVPFRLAWRNWGMHESTPMRLYPPDAEHRLGFDLIRERLEGYARTPYGRERLELLEPSADRGEVAARLEKAGEMQALLGFDDPFPGSAAVDIRPLLSRIGPVGSAASGEEVADAGRALTTLRLVHDFLNARKAKYASLWTVAKQIVSVKAVEEEISRAVDELGRVKDDASSELLRLSRTLADRHGKLRDTLLRALRNAIAQGWATEEQPTIRAGRAVIPIRAEAKRKVQGFIHDVSATGQTVYIEPASVLDLNNEIRELESERGREIERILKEVTGRLRLHRQDVAVGLNALGQLDAHAAIGRLANDLNARVPALNDDGHVRFVGARNPVLALHFKEEGGEREVIPIDLELGDGAVTLVITGPNAGGKSVAMKTVGVLSLMAQCGIPVPSDPGTSLPLFSRLFVDLGDRQSIQEDLSTFTSHLSAIARMLDEADDRSLVLIDEAGTGTDPAEGGALAQAILQRLTEQGARTIATTHHGALKAFAHTAEGVENGSMHFDRETLAPTYRFQSGIPGSSYAFEIAERVGLDKDVVASARELVGEGKAALEDLIADFESRTQEAEERRGEAAAQLASAERIRADYKERLEHIRDVREKLKAEALEEAEQIVKGANATVEKTIREIKEANAEREATMEARKQLEAAADGIAQKRKKAARRAPRSEKVSPAPNRLGPIQPGDQVRIDGSSAVGEVVELDEREAVVAFGGMTSRAKLERLSKVGGRREQKVDVRALRASTPVPSFMTTRTHIDVRGQRIDEAIPEVMRFVDEAGLASAPSVEILHGKGTGALRAAVREHLAERDDVASFDSAPWNQGGDGVTMVVLR